VVRSSTCFQAYDTCRQVRKKKWRHFVSLESSPQDDAFVVDSVHLKYTLGNIQPDCRNLLEPASSIK